ncbi:hypothetical protein DCO46_09580 [Flavobacterium sp. HTF]|nr:hypothetical protein DCO46_09580 [Flavobacterium sp. HTF]
MDFNPSYIRHININKTNKNKKNLLNLPNLRETNHLKKSGFRFQVSSFKFQVSGFRFQVSSFKFHVATKPETSNLKQKNYLTGFTLT